MYQTFEIEYVLWRKSKNLFNYTNWLAIYPKKNVGQFIVDLVFSPRLDYEFILDNLYVDIANMIPQLSKLSIMIDWDTLDYASPEFMISKGFMVHPRKEVAIRLPTQYVRSKDQYVQLTDRDIRFSNHFKREEYLPWCDKIIMSDNKKKHKKESIE